VSSARAWIASCILLSCCLLPFPATAQYTVEQPSRVWVRGLLDVRANGGHSQAAVQIGTALPWEIRGQAQLNLQPRIAHGYHPWLVEAFLRKEWTTDNRGWAVESGVLHVPFSLENTGPAWSPAYSISSSALSSWLWEEITLSGADTEWWRTIGSAIQVDALVGAGYGADQVGRLLALRGWVMGDTLGGINGSLRLPGNGGRTDIYNERDHRPAVYGWLSLGDPGQIASIKVGMFDNRGDESSRGVWHTRFTTAGVIIHTTAHLDLLAQYLAGTARVAAPANDSSYSAAYILASGHFRQHRVSLRFDQFRVHDLDGGPSPTNERGRAVTTSYLLQIGLRQRIALEYIWLHGRRELTGPLDPTPDGWQVSYRFRY
jgi:hypothetical protein